jgi:hypothetical protein
MCSKQARFFGDVFDPKMGGLRINQPPAFAKALAGMPPAFVLKASFRWQNWRSKIENRPYN